MLLGLAVATVLAGCGAAPLPTDLVPAAPAAAPAAPAAALPAARPTSPGPVREVASLSPSAPVRVEVPAIGVRTGPLVDLRIDAAGAMEVPPDAGTAGWFALAPAPGSVGPAVIAAHVDYAGVSGVFARLRDLAPGDEVQVWRADGTEAVFRTHRVDRYLKSDFPTDLVYGDTEGPELRLITCGGSFDRGTGQYRDNVVAYARLVGVR